MRKVDYLLQSLSTGSKNRLRQYMSGLTLTIGDTEEGRNFDKELFELLKLYVKDPKDFDDIVQYLDQLICEDGYPYSRSLRVYEVTEDGLSRFCQKDHTSFRWNENYQKSLKYYESIVANWNLVPLSFMCDDDIEAALPKMDTHSGYTFIETGEKEKGNNMEGIYNLYLQAEEKALECGSFNRPIMTAFRTQVSGEFDDDGIKQNHAKHKTRTVCMVDLLRIIGELMFANPIQSRFALEDWYAGGKDRTDISSIIHDFHYHCKYFASTDYSSYDQTVSSWLIEDAFNVLKKAFKKLTPRQVDLYDIMVHDFIHKDFITAHGVLHSDKGIPSGSMFTQIIGSLINCIIMRTYYYSIGKEDRCIRMITMGDDNASFTDSPISIDDMASYLMKNFGVIVKTDDKTMFGGPRDNVKFLSTIWKVDGPYRHPHQLLARLLYSERPRVYDDTITPAHVILAFCLTYTSMNELIYVSRFRHDYPIGDVEIKNLDSRYVPGVMAYIRDYTMKR